MAKQDKMRADMQLNSVMYSLKGTNGGAEEKKEFRELSY